MTLFFFNTFDDIHEAASLTSHYRMYGLQFTIVDMSRDEIADELRHAVC